MATLSNNVKQLPTNVSTWVVAILMGLVAYWMQLPLAEQQALIAAYPWLKHVAPLAGLLTFLGSRVWPQHNPPAEPPAEEKQE
jgi:hypothetical protein